MKDIDKTIDAICSRIVYSPSLPSLIIINSKLHKKLYKGLKKRLNQTEKGVIHFLGVRTIGSKQVGIEEIIIK